MPKPVSKKLLKDARVRDEIDRHKWIESEKAGYDIGFDRAAEDWISRYADDWEEATSKREGKAVRKVKARQRALSD